MLNHSTTYLSITSLREKAKAGGLRELWHNAEALRRKDNCNRRVITSVIVLICVDGALEPRGI